jgi:hypothetical protein
MGRKAMGAHSSRAGQGDADVGDASAAAEPRLPRGSRETAALLRANGYSILNQQKLRRHRQEAAAAPAVMAQQRGRQPTQPERHVRVEQPASPPARRNGEKRKHIEPSSSEDELPARVARVPTVQQPPAAQEQQQQQPAGALKRVRSTWKMRPLLVGVLFHQHPCACVLQGHASIASSIICRGKLACLSDTADEKLTVFLEGRDEALLEKYDSGEFYQWLRDCEAGRFAASPRASMLVLPST